MPTTGWSASIEEIVVTTRRREENIQDIPVAVAAFNADFIEKQGVVSTKDVVKLVPGVQFDQGFSAADTRISIRGINNSRGRASVATLIDGVDISGENISAGGGSSLLNTRLLDLERIEVVKGPQSALYGRNAFAGALNYITKQPNMEELDGYLSFEAAEYNSVNARAGISGPVIKDVLALQANFAAFNSDGYYNNNYSFNDTDETDLGGNDQDLNGYESVGGRVAALWTPTEKVSVTAALTYANDKSDPRAVAKFANANTFYDSDGNVLNGVSDPATPGIAYGHWLGTVGDLKEDKVALSATGDGGEFAGSEDERWLATLKLDWDIGGTTFTSLTSYLDNQATLAEDVDYQNGEGTNIVIPPFPQAGFPYGVDQHFSVANDYLDKTDTKQFTQDFTLQSNSWERGTWLIGAQYFREEANNTDNSLGWFNGSDIDTLFLNFGGPDIPLCGSNPFFMQVNCTYEDSAIAGIPAKTTDRDTTSYSLYGLVSFDFTEKLSATFEGRYIRDEIEVTTNTAIDRVSQYLLNYPIDLAGFAPQPVPLPISDKKTTSTFNPRVAVDYRFTDGLMMYGSVAKGTKPGGFGTTQFAIPQDARMEQETLWSYELGTKTSWLDSTLQANAAIFFNDYKDRQVGITVESPLTGWRASGVSNAGGQETKGIEADVLWTPTDILTLGLGYAYTDAKWTKFNYSEIREDGATDKDKAICGNEDGDCSGARVAGIPEHAITLLGNVTAPINDDLEWFLNTTAQWQDKRSVSDQVNTAYVDSFWNVDAQLGLQNDKWNVMLFATNLFDNDTIQWGQNYQDFKDGMWSFGQPRDEAVMGFLPAPRVAGVRASFKF